jgi:hypothetical protein
VTGAAVGLAGRVGYVWYNAKCVAIAAYKESRKRFPLGGRSNANEYSSAIYRAHLATGLVTTVGGIAITLGAGAAGAVVLPVIVGLGYYYFAG